MEECLFCKIAMGEVPSDKIYEDENFLAFLDINPRNPGHALVITKKHYQTLMEVPDNELSDLILIVKKMAIAVKTGMKADGISIGQSNERAAGQVIPHVHFHVIPRFNSEGPPGLESILPVKKLPKETMDKLVEVVKTGMESGGVPETETEEEKPEETEKPAEEKGEEPEEKSKEETETEKPEKPEVKMSPETKKKVKEEIDFDF